MFINIRKKMNTDWLVYILTFILLIILHTMFECICFMAVVDSIERCLFGHNEPMNKQRRVEYAKDLDNYNHYLKERAKALDRRAHSLEETTKDLNNYNSVLKERAKALDRYKRVIDEYADGPI